MTTYTCPEGHTSNDPDYCDTCGAPIGAASSSAAGSPATSGAGSAGGGAAGGGAAGGGAAGGGAGGGGAGSAAPAGGSVLDLGPPGGDGGAATAAPAAQTCPNCGDESAPGALFCEDCGYDFTTGAMPSPPPSPSEAAPEAPPDISPDTPPVGSAVPPVTPASAPAPRAPKAGDGVVEWVAELWVDPDWYALQGSDEPCPSAGLPQVVPLTGRSLLIGRVSVSRNIHPDVDCSADSGVSRRHAQLTTDGQRWWVEDLQSSNGTFVGEAGGALPDTPIQPGARRELAEDDRLYLGAWTRIVIRRATPEDQASGGR